MFNTEVKGCSKSTSLSPFSTITPPKNCPQTLCHPCYVTELTVTNMKFSVGYNNG